MAWCQTVRNRASAAEAEAARLREAVKAEQERIVARIKTMRPHYQSNTATDAGRRQMLDYFEEFVTGALDQPARDEVKP